MRVWCAATAFILCAAPAASQPALPGDSDTLRARAGSELAIPLGSLVVPGLGQFIHRASGAGAAFLGTAFAGAALSLTGDAWTEDVPRGARDQFAEQAATTAATAGMLSAWDAFHRAVPALQARGRYDFLTRRESVGDLLGAPFDFSHLRRWTTWIDLAQTALVTALILSERESDTDYYPFRGHDAIYTTALSENAAVGEEALFRGWLLPLLHQNTGRRFWVANGIQAGVFGAAHLPEAEWFAAWIGAWAFWEGWLVRRNEWSIRESIFHHFWYDVGVVTASLLTHKRDPQVTIRLPTIRF